MPRRAARPTVLALSGLAVLALLGAGCGPRATPTPVSAEEQILLEKLQADPFIELMTIERTGVDGRGPLLVTTRQGDTRVRYLVSPALQPERGVAGIVRVDDRSLLDTREPARNGTGPAERR